ncbi:MAG: hypothetical protein JWQ08_407 [Deinococcus sp.]|nr:hypothetical protein [Deinococcus sp.]
MKKSWSFVSVLAALALDTASAVGTTAATCDLPHGHARQSVADLS